MEKNNTGNRLSALDGVRGFAIILVVLTHVDASYITPHIPSLFNPLLKMIFTSGVTGVSLLFILSGFLMGYIYPQPKSYTGFLQKRYTRIFPLFLTMCTVMLFYRIFPDMQWYVRLILLFSLALFSHAVWVYGIKKVASQGLNKTLFYLFCAVQVFAALLYAFWIMRHPAIAFNQQLAEPIRNGIIWLVNATLTLPLGDYIPQLDGVYWSLAAEILFYIFYPILCVPIIKLLIPQSRIVKIIFLLALVPFFAGINIMAQRILGLSLLQIQLFNCFACGITLAYIYKHHPDSIKQLNSWFKGKLFFVPTVLFFAVILAKTLLFDPMNKTPDAWIHLLWAYPITLVIASALDKESSLSKILSSKFLVFLGTVSFSIYLCHIPVRILLMQLYKPTDTFSNALFLLLYFSLTGLIASLLYYLLERPYFLRISKKETVQKSEAKIFYHSYKKSSIALLSAVLIPIIALLTTYQSNFNFFSKEYAISRSDITSPIISKNQTLISMHTSPKIVIEFTAQEDDLQVLAGNVHKVSENEKLNTSQNFIFKIKNKDAKDWYAVNTYDYALIPPSNNLPFGFPAIQDAKGKKYIVELSLSNPKAVNYTELDISEEALKNIYKVDKKTLLTNPLKLISFVLYKGERVLANTEAQSVFMLLLPFIFLSLYLIGKKIVKK
jgi:peptidoglycan/LPS O-acetylase OafA/YrhL